MLDKVFNWCYYKIRKDPCKECLVKVRCENEPFFKRRTCKEYDKFHATRREGINFCHDFTFFVLSGVFVFTILLGVFIFLKYMMDI